MIIKDAGSTWVLEMADPPQPVEVLHKQSGQRFPADFIGVFFRSDTKRTRFIQLVRFRERTAVWEHYRSN